MAALDEQNAGEAATAQQLAGAYVREQILSGSFPAGMRLKTEELATKLGISRMPVRDALQQLHSEGLVVIRPNRGAVVTRLTSNEVLELFEIRAALEGLASRHACKNFTPEILESLESLLSRMNQATDDLLRWLRLHDEFHDLICSQSNRPRLLRQIHNARQAVLPYVRMYVSVYHRVEIPNAEHEILVSIARRANPELLEAAMQDHILSAGRGVTNFLEQHGPEPVKQTNGPNGGA